MTTSTPTMTLTLTGRDYFRVSKDDSGRERSPAEQHDDNRQRWAGELTFNGESYAEPEAISASRFSPKKNRGGFERLTADLANGRFGADVLVLWEPSRGSRKAGEWCDLIDLCADAGVRIAVTTHGRIYDARNGRDRRTLQEDAVDSEYESYKISERVLRAMNANAESGKPHGRIPFGYRRRYNERTRELITQEKDPDEAPIIEELFKRLERGHSLKSIARDFKDQGITNRSGKPFTPQALRSLAMSPVYRRKRVHDGKETEGTWDLIVPKSMVLAVQSMLSDESRKTSRSGHARHLLSNGIARCDVCGGKLAVEIRKGRPVYRCHESNCVTVGKAELDDVAERAIVEFLSREDQGEQFTAEDDDALARVRGEIAEIRAELDQLEADVESGEVSARMATKAEAGILKRLEDAERRRDELQVPSQLRRLFPAGRHVAEHWAQMPIEARRDAARLVLSPLYVGELRVKRSTQRGSIQDRIVWR